MSANDIDRPVGSVVYTQWCDERGGMVADVTVTRLADDRFRVVTGAGYLASELAWLRTPRRGRRGRRRSATSAATSRRSGCGGPGRATSWSPRAPRPTRSATTASRCAGAGAIRVGPAPVDAARISYAGELGWELTTPVAWAVTVWDRLRAAGAEFGLEPFGYRALDALRMEKGYRYFGTDLTMLDTPFEAGLGAFVRLGKGPFIGRDALVAAQAQPDRTAASGPSSSAAPTTNPIYGGEAVRLDGEVVGRLRSVAYGPTVERTIGYAYLPAAMPEGAGLEVDVFDRRVAAVIAPDVVVDPLGDRMRG